ncbi:hypothetical protein GUJ93_ZPchr0002g24223 [Zizania palustris]|uniref:Uncharacterized protein n=1 Tax=Zizania palustris TaxID=103762 RepID=A0A8J5VCI0_ZIZPA|nr:hypothetical protein GUJ93_ZPchr0002g24223 [Zizania palustris]
MVWATGRRRVRYGWREGGGYGAEAAAEVAAGWCRVRCGRRGGRGYGAAVEAEVAGEVAGGERRAERCGGGNREAGRRGREAIGRKI